MHGQAAPSCPPLAGGQEGWGASFPDPSRLHPSGDSSVARGEESATS